MKINSKSFTEELSGKFLSSHQKSLNLHRYKSGCSAVRLAHHVRDVGVAGSNPVIPTFFFSLCYGM